MQTALLFLIWLGFGAYILAVEYQETGGRRRARRFRRVRG